MTDDSTWSIGPSEEDVIADLIRRNVFTPSADGANRMAAMIDDRAYTIAVPAGHFAIVLPITDSATDDVAQIIDHAIALHHVTEQLDTGEDG